MVSPSTHLSAPHTDSLEDDTACIALTLNEIESTETKVRQQRSSGKVDLYASNKVTSEELVSVSLARDSFARGWQISLSVESLWVQSVFRSGNICKLCMAGVFNEVQER